jgi:prephenate dehydrogenase
MNTLKPRITIVGLGLIGGSIGLALREAGVASNVIGHDKERSASTQAEKLGAVDRTDWNLVSACEGSDLIILATPVGAIEGTMRAIGPYLEAGCVVMDTASLKEPVLAWAAETLPEKVHFVGGNPILSQSVDSPGGLEAARADLFRNGLFCVVPSPTADPAAVKLVTDLVAILGAKPLFFDPLEHDGQLAAVEHLPAILALALVETVSRQPIWRDLRQVAGPAFEISTHLVAADPAAHRDMYLSNRDNIVRWIDVFTASLTSIRQALVENRSEELVGRFGDALSERGKWLQDRASGQWQEGPRPEMPTRASMLEGLFGTFWRRKPKTEES